MKQLAHAVYNYATDHNDTLPAGASAIADVPVNQRLSWIWQIVPYTESAPWWDSAANTCNTPAMRKLATRDWPTIRCPCQSHAGKGTPLPTAYIGVAGVGVDAPDLPAKHERAGVFGYNRVTRLLDIPDGMANTALLIESANQTTSWMAAGPGTIQGCDTTRKPYIGHGCQFGSLHGDGTNIAFVDGSVRWVKRTINPRALESMSTISGNDIVGPEMTQLD